MGIILPGDEKESVIIPDLQNDPKSVKQESIGTEEVIINPYPGKEMLTPEQAIDAINKLSGILLVYERR